MSIYLLVLWLVLLAGIISAVVVVSTDKRVRHSHGLALSERGLIAVIGEQTNAWTFAGLNDEATTQLNRVRHPLHPMLIVFPLGLLATAVAFDIAALVSGDNGWFNVSFLVMGAGILCGLLAALPGLADWVAIPRNTRPKAIGSWHGGGNVVVLLLFAISWFLRHRRAEVPNSGALVLSFFALLLALITSWLGGALADRLAVDAGAHLNASSSLSVKPPITEPEQPMRRAS